MCGISGFQGTFSRDLLDSMSRAIAHRGPDGDGSAILRTPFPGVSNGLAHRRLAIIDVSEHGRQPIGVACARCGAASLDDLALTYNGELYNYRELRAELESRGHIFHSHTDSEVLLHLYGEQGTGMLERLNGIFAFAIHDGRARAHTDGQAGDLFLARDPLGVKPLYVSETPSGVLFASEIKAVLQCRELSRSLDLEALHYHLAYLWTPAPRTLLEGVRKLEPGCALVVRAGAVARRWRWYDLPYDGDRLTDEPDAIAAALEQQVASAVERQLVSDVPVGAFLSGGLDSSAVVAMMRRAGAQTPRQCYTIGFAGESSVEGTPSDVPYARRVAAALGVSLRTIEIGPEIIGHLDEMLYHLDEPQADPAPINALLIARQARADGIPVLLSGAGGDDIFSGYRRHYALRLERMWRWLPHAARTGIARSARSIAEGRRKVPQSLHTVRRAVKSLTHADYDGDAGLASYFWWSTDGLRRSLYSPALAESTARIDSASPLVASLARIPREDDRLQRMLFLETTHFLADHNLNYTDKMGMAAGVEVRVPLLDLDLVRFAARIPPSLKQRGRTGKAIFKQAMAGVLPNDVLHRPKSGFGAPLRRWLRVELRDRVDDTLSAHSLGARGLFEPRAVQRLIELDRSGHVDGAYTIFALMCIELWCRQFVDATPSAVHRLDARTSAA